MVFLQTLAFINTAGQNKFNQWRQQNIRNRNVEYSNVVNRPEFKVFMQLETDHPKNAIFNASIDTVWKHFFSKGINKCDRDEAWWLFRYTICGGYAVALTEQVISGNAIVKSGQIFVPGACEWMLYGRASEAWESDLGSSLRGRLQTTDEESSGVVDTGPRGDLGNALFFLIDSGFYFGRILEDS